MGVQIMMLEKKSIRINTLRLVEIMYYLQGHLLTLTGQQMVM